VILAIGIAITDISYGNAFSTGAMELFFLAVVWQCLGYKGIEEDKKTNAY